MGNNNINYEKQSVPFRLLHEIFKVEPNKPTDL